MYIALSSCTYLKEQHSNENIYGNKMVEDMQLPKPRGSPRMTWTFAQRSWGPGIDLGHLLETRPWSIHIYTVSLDWDRQNDKFVERSAKSRQYLFAAVWMVGSIHSSLGWSIDIHHKSWRRSTNTTWLTLAQEKIFWASIACTQPSCSCTEAGKAGNISTRNRQSLF